MKTKYHHFAFLLFAITSLSCSSDWNNSVSIKSTAAENVYLNFLGKVITIAPNSTQSIKNIIAGEYSYDTSFDSPSGVQGISTEGPASGSLTLSASTKISIFYSSRIQITSGTGSTGQSNYILITTVSSSDKTTSSGVDP